MSNEINLDHEKFELESATFKNWGVSYILPLTNFAFEHASGGKAGLRFEQTLNEGAILFVVKPENGDVRVVEVQTSGDHATATIFHNGSDVSAMDIEDTSEDLYDFINRVCPDKKTVSMNLRSFPETPEPTIHLNFSETGLTQAEKEMLASIHETFVNDGAEFNIESVIAYVLNYGREVGIKLVPDDENDAVVSQAFVDSLKNLLSEKFASGMGEGNKKISDNMSSMVLGHLFLYAGVGNNHPNLNPSNLKLSNQALIGIPDMATATYEDAKEFLQYAGASFTLRDFRDFMAAEPDGAIKNRLLQLVGNDFSSIINAHNASPMNTAFLQECAFLNMPDKDMGRIFFSSPRNFVPVITEKTPGVKNAHQQLEAFAEIFPYSERKKGMEEEYGNPEVGIAQAIVSSFILFPKEEDITMIKKMKDTNVIGLLGGEGITEMSFVDDPDTMKFINIVSKLDQMTTAAISDARIPGPSFNPEVERNNMTERHEVDAIISF